MDQEKILGLFKPSKFSFALRVRLFWRYAESIQKPTKSGSSSLFPSTLWLRKLQSAKESDCLLYNFCSFQGTTRKSFGKFEKCRIFFRKDNQFFIFPPRPFSILLTEFFSDQLLRPSLLCSCLCCTDLLQLNLSWYWRMIC